MREKVLEKINGSVFTISAPSYRLGDAPQVCRSHILAVLIVFSRRVVDEKKTKRAKLSIARGNFNCLLIINRRPVNHTTRATRTNLSPSLFLPWVEGKEGLLSRNRQTRRRDKDTTRDAHTREARSRLARPARRDLRPLRQRHLLHTDAAPAAAGRPPAQRSPSSLALTCLQLARNRPSVKVAFFLDDF